MPYSKKFLTDPFNQFIKKQSSSSIIMILAMLMALLIANSTLQNAYHAFWETYTGFSFGDFMLKKHLSHWINDGLMALFFLVIGLEVKREILIGELSTPQKAMFPIVGALGGAVVPALIYVGFNLGGGSLDGWGIPMATDIAFAIGILALLGNRVPVNLKVFLTSLAVVDDMIAVLVIAIFYTAEIKVAYLIYTAVVLVVLFAANRSQIRSITVYLILGAFMWYFLLKSGVHATIAGVLLALFIPTEPKIGFKVFSRASRKAIDDFDNCVDDPNTEIPTKCQKQRMNRLIQVAFAAYNPLSRLEYNLHGFSAFVIMPIFAFANVGISMSAEMFQGVFSPESLGIIVGLFIGKPLGIAGSLFLAVRMKLVHMPDGLNMQLISGAAILGGIGLTMSIFIANMAFSGSATLENAKLAILTSSVVAGFCGFVYLKNILKKELPIYSAESTEE